MGMDGNLKRRDLATVIRLRSGNAQVGRAQVGHVQFSHVCVPCPRETCAVPGVGNFGRSLPVRQNMSAAFRRACIQGVQFLAGFKTDGFTGSDADFSPGSRVAPDAGLAGPDAEDAEAAQLDPVASGESVFEPLEHCIHRCLRLGSRQACPLDDVMDNILLDQCRRPLKFGVLEVEYFCV